MADIFHLFNIKTEDTSKVYKAITEQEGLASWWTTDTKAVPEVGSIAEFRFTKDYYKGMKVTNLENDNKVEWECIHGHEEWIGTKVIFELEKLDNSVDIKFYHNSWKEVTNMYGICNYHWGLYLKSLKTYIETGTGNPHKP